MTYRSIHRPLRLAAAALLALSACEGEPTATDPSFLDGTEGDPQVGIVLNGLGRSLTLFHAGSPQTQQQIPLGSSDAVTPTGAAVRGRRVAVPLGNAASVVIVNLESAQVEGAYTFPAGNATGVAWVDDETLVAANLTGDYVGRILVGANLPAIGDTAHVAPAPTAVVVARGRAFVVSGNLDDSFAPLGNGIVSVVDPQAMRVTATITVGLNPQAAAVGPDGRVYVLNTGDYGAVEGSISIIDPQTLVVEQTVPGFGTGPGSITIDAAGLAYVSSYSYGTAVWDTKTRQFVRGPATPLCSSGPIFGCRGAAHAAAGTDGTVYQAFLGTATDPARVLVYRRQGADYAPPEEITAGAGPLWLDVRTFR